MGLVFLTIYNYFTVCYFYGPPPLSANVCFLEFSHSRRCTHLALRVVSLRPAWGLVAFGIPDVGAVLA